MLLQRQLARRHLDIGMLSGIMQYQNDGGRGCHRRLAQRCGQRAGRGAGGDQHQRQRGRAGAAGRASLGQHRGEASGFLVDDPSLVGRLVLGVRRRLRRRGNAGGRLRRHGCRRRRGRARPRPARPVGGPAHRPGPAPDGAGLQRRDAGAQQAGFRLRDRQRGFQPMLGGQRRLRETCPVGLDDSTRGLAAAVVHPAVQFAACSAARWRTMPVPSSLHRDKTATSIHGPMASVTPGRRAGGGTAATLSVRRDVVLSPRRHGGKREREPPAL